MNVTPLARVVLADIGNVLVRATHEITFAILEDYGVAPRDARQFFTASAYAEFARGIIDDREFSERIRELVRDHHVRRRLGEREIRVAHDAHIYAVDEAVSSVLLTRLTVPLMFATDTNVWQTERVRALLTVEAFATRTFSSNELGALKRDPGTFERIAEEIGEEPRRICFIDDNAKNIARATQAGFDAVRFTDAPALVAALRVRHIWTS